jgi:hypothetical protein
MSISLPVNVFQENIVNEEECCAICLNNLNTELTYMIEECKHKFHTNCLLTWFRTNNSSCPTCRNINNEPSFYERKHKFSLISSYCRRKNANTYVVNMMEKYKKQKRLATKHMLEFSNFKKNNKDLLKEYLKLRNKKQKSSWELTKLKRHITDIPIMPLNM